MKFFEKGVSLCVFIMCSMGFIGFAKGHGLDNPQRLQQMLSEAKSRCSMAQPNDAHLTQADIRPSQGQKFTQDTMRQNFQSVYLSNKRLKDRTFFDGQKDRFIMPFPTRNSFKPIHLEVRFIKSIIRNVEVALENDYVQYIYFPDMGHSHLLIPLDYYNQEIASLPQGNSHLVYEKALAYEGTKFLYHTAEKLQMTDNNRKLLDNEYLQWRYYTRNPVGDNMAKGTIRILKLLGDVFNTVRSLEGHRYYAGFNISANENGCFPYEHKGKKYYFDISLKDLPYDPNSSGGWGL